MSQRYKSRFSKRSLRKRILVFTEGQTEKDYLNCFKSHIAKKGVKIKVYGIGRGKLALIQKVIQKIGKENIITGDQVWAVLDGDRVAGQKDREVFSEACRLAEKNDIKIAYSNNSFEVWLLLHFQDLNKAMNNAELSVALNRYFGKYQKKGQLIYDTCQQQGDYVKACMRAEKLLKEHVTKGNLPVDANPSTTIHQLLGVIEKSGDK